MSVALNLETPMYIIMTNNYSKLFAAALALLVAAGPAHADILTYHAKLDGPSEAPPNASPGTGWATVRIDTVTGDIRIRAEFSGLQGPTTAAHIHGPTADPLSGAAGVMTQTPSFIGFPLGVTQGSFDQTYSLLDSGFYRPGFLAAFLPLYNNDTALATAAASEAFLASLRDGKAYFNVHSTSFPGGEIRGFFQAPDGGATLALLSLGLAGMGGVRRWLRSRG